MVFPLAILIGSARLLGSAILIFGGCSRCNTNRECKSNREAILIEDIRYVKNNFLVGNFLIKPMSIKMSTDKVA